MSSIEPAKPFQFSLQERDRRWALVRRLMAEQGANVLVAFPQWMAGDALYLANRPGAVVFPLSSEPTLVLARAQAGSRPGSWIERIQGATATGTTAVPWGEAVARCLRELGAERNRIAIAGLRGGRYTLVRQPEGYVNYTSVAEIRETLPEATVLDGTPIMTEARYVPFRKFEWLTHSESLSKGREAAVSSATAPVRSAIPTPRSWRGCRRSRTDAALAPPGPPRRA